MQSMNKIISLSKFGAFFKEFQAFTGKLFNPSFDLVPPIDIPLGDVKEIDQILSQITVSPEVTSILKQLTIKDIFLQMVMIDPGFMALSNERLSSDLPIGSLLAGGDSGPDMGTSWQDFNGKNLLLPQNFNLENWARYVQGYKALAIKPLTDGRFIHPFFGADNVHGGNKTGGIVFPTNSLMGCIPSSDQKDFLTRQGKYVAQMTKAVGANMVFGPEVDITNPKTQLDKHHVVWGRTEECYSSAPPIARECGKSFIKGLQDERVIAVTKHFVGEGYADKDQGISPMTFQELDDALEPFQAAIQAGTASIMLAYNSVLIKDSTGKKLSIPIKCHDHQILVQYLREKMGFSGILMSDWAALDQLITGQSYITDENGKHKDFKPGIYSKEDFKKVLERGFTNADLDIVMQGDRLKLYFESIQELYLEKKISLEKLLQSAARILQVKLNFGLINNQPLEAQAMTYPSDEIREFAKLCVEKGTVLSKGDKADLLIDADTSILMGGDCDHMGRQCGGWTGKWQGLDETDIPVLNQQGATYFNALREARHGKVFKMNSSLPNLVQKPVGIYVISDKPSAEWFGDKKKEELKLSPQTIQEIKSLKNQVAKLIVILSTGQPVILDDVHDDANLVLYMGRPGPQGGPALAEILAGKSIPEGVMDPNWDIIKSW